MAERYTWVRRHYRFVRGKFVPVRRHKRKIVAAALGLAGAYAYLKRKDISERYNKWRERRREELLERLKKQYDVDMVRVAGYTFVRIRDKTDPERRVFAYVGKRRMPADEWLLNYYYKVGSPPNVIVDIE